MKDLIETINFMEKMNVKEMVETLKSMEDNLQEMHYLVSTQDISEEELKNVDYYVDRVNSIIGLLMDEVAFKNK